MRQSVEQELELAGRLISSLEEGAPFLEIL